MAQVTPATDSLAQQQATEAVMITSEVDIIIARIQQLAEHLDSLPGVADAQMAVQYLRHLRSAQSDQ